MKDISEEKALVAERTILFFKIQLICPINITDRKNRILKMSVVGILMLGLLYELIGHLVAVLTGKIDSHLDEDLAVICSVIASSQAYFAFSFYLHDYRNITKDLSSFQQFPEPTSFRATCKSCNNFVTAYYSLTVTSNIFYYIYSQTFVRWDCEKAKEKGEIQDLCGLFLPAYFWYIPVESELTKRFVSLQQIMATLIVTNGAALVTISAYEICEHLAGRFKHRKELMVEEKEAQRKLEDYVLYRWIDYHDFILSLAERTNDCYRIPMSIHVMLTSAILAVITNQLWRTHSLAAFFHLLAWVLALFFICKGGQDVMSESISVATQCYNMNWINMNVTQRKAFCMFLIRAQKPFRFYAGKFGTFSYPLFMQVLNTSYSFLILLLNKGS